MHPIATKLQTVLCVTRARASGIGENPISRQDCHRAKYNFTGRSVSTAYGVILQTVKRDLFMWAYCIGMRDLLSRKG